MLRYWDKAPAERAELDEESIRALLDVERMEKGLTKPRPPKLAELPEAEPKTRRYYRVVYQDREYGSRSYIDVIFETPEAAQALIDLKPQVCHADWRAGDVKYAAPLERAAVEPVDVATVDEVNRLKPALVERKNAQEANLKVQSEYDKAVQEWTDGADEIWDDYRKQVAIAERHRGVLDTYGEYLWIAEGDERTAGKFLAKAYSEEDIRAAYEWFEENCPPLPSDPVEMSAVAEDA